MNLINIIKVESGFLGLVLIDRDYLINNITI